jgi:predicted nucleotidyltransferase
MILEDDIQQYGGELMAAYSEIESVWLFGSRANGTNRPESDWDLLAFGSREIASSLRADRKFHHERIDLVVVYDGDQFEKPWGEKKSGSLSEWQWQPRSAVLATYRTTKPVYNEHGEEEFNVKL